MSSQLEKMPKKFHVFIHSVNPSSLFIGGRIGFLKNYRKEGSRFSCKNGGVGGGGVYRSYRRGAKLCFSFLVYAFCRSNALYAASLLFRMFIFLLTPFNT